MLVVLLRDLYTARYTKSKINFYQVFFVCRAVRSGIFLRVVALLFFTCTRFAADGSAKCSLNNILERLYAFLVIVCIMDVKQY